MFCVWGFPSPASRVVMSARRLVQAMPSRRVNLTCCYRYLPTSCSLNTERGAELEPAQYVEHCYKPSTVEPIRITKMEYKRNWAVSCFKENSMAISHNIHCRLFQVLAFSPRLQGASLIIVGRWPSAHDCKGRHWSLSVAGLQPRTERGVTGHFRSPAFSPGLKGASLVIVGRRPSAQD